MRGHVVVALQRMRIVGLAFADQPVEDRPEVPAHVGIGALVDRQSGRRVADEEIHEPRRRQCGQVGDDLVRDGVEAPGAGAERE